MTESHNDSRNREMLHLAAILGTALAFRLVLLNYRWAIGFDEAHYLRMAAGFLRDGWGPLLHPYWPPMYSLFIALFSLGTGAFETAARLVSIFAGTASILPAYFLAKELFDRRAARFSAWALALFPPFAFAATAAMAESLLGALQCFAIWLGWLAIRKRSMLAAGGAGVLAALAYLTKPEGIGTLIVFIAAGFAAVLFSSEYRRRGFYLSLLATIIAFLAVAGPYLIYLRQETGIWTLSLKFQVNQQFSALYRMAGKDPDVRHRLTADDRILPTDLAYHEGRFQILLDRTRGAAETANAGTVHIGPALMLKKYVQNFYKVANEELPAVLTLAPLIFAVLGMAARPWPQDRAGLHGYLLSYLVFYWFVVFPFIHLNPRYFLPLLPVWFVWAGRGMIYVTDWARQTAATLAVSKYNRNLIAKFCAAGVILLPLLAFSYAPELGKIVKRSAADPSYWADAVELKKAGLWLKANTEAVPVLMSYNKAVDFYAGGRDVRQGVTFPIDADFARILRYARYKNVDYLVLSDRYRERFPALQFLFEKKEVPAVLELVYEDEFPPGIRTVIYRLKKETPATSTAARRVQRSR